MKKLLAILLAVILVFAFTACGGDTTTSSKDIVEVDETELAKVSLENALKATTELDYEAIERYYVEPIITKEGMEGLGEAGHMIRLFLSKVQGAVTKCVQKDEENMVATVGLTTVDFNELIKILTPKMMETVEDVDINNLTTEQMTELQKASVKLIEETFAGEDVPTVANTILVDMQKVDGEWKISNNDTLYEELLGDLERVVEYMVQ